MAFVDWSVFHVRMVCPPAQTRDEGDQYAHDVERGQGPVEVEVGSHEHRAHLCWLKGTRRLPEKECPQNEDDDGGEVENERHRDRRQVEEVDALEALRYGETGDPRGPRLRQVPAVQQEAQLTTSEGYDGEHFSCRQVAESHEG